MVVLTVEPSRFRLREPRAQPGSEEGPGTLGLELSPGVTQLHEDHPRLLLVRLPGGLRERR